MSLYTDRGAYCFHTLEKGGEVDREHGLDEGVERRLPVVWAPARAPAMPSASSPRKPNLLVDIRRDRGAPLRYPKWTAILTSAEI